MIYFGKVHIEQATTDSAVQVQGQAPDQYKSWVSLSTLIAALALCMGLSACGKDRPPPVQEVDGAPVLSPEEALRTFSVPPGFSVELVAAEPLVVDPVDIDIDPDGRIWVVEMRGFMTDLVKREEDYHKGQVVVLEDENGDGRMDRRTVFLDSLLLPRSVLVLKEGVLVAAPPHLWLVKDTDGDLKADTTIEVRADYGLPPSVGNPEATANSPTWGLDNWIHSTHYPGRLRYTGSSWQYDSTLALGQWGLAMGNYGRFYRTWNSNPLFVAMLDPHYFTRNPNLIEVHAVDVAIGDDAKKVWPIRPTWVNRGYRENVLRENGTLRMFTAASGPAVYRGDRYPEAFQGDVFVPEPAAHLVRRFEIIEHEDGTMEAVNAYDKAEFMASTDGRFRPVNMYSAPDGTLYVVDMYQGVIEWRRFLTSYLEHHIKKRGLLKPKGMGRIYRIVYEPNPPEGEAPQLTSVTSRQLVAYLAHPNGWWRDAAQQLLVERGAKNVAPALQEMVRSAKGELMRLHALWTLDGLGVLDIQTLRHALSDDSPAVRAAAVRNAEPWLRKGNKEVLQDVADLTADPAPEVRLQLAASLGEAPSPSAEAAMAQLLTNASDQPYLIETVVSGLNGRELEFLQRLVQMEHWQEQTEGYVQALQTLAATVVNTGNTEKMNRMLQLIGGQADLPQWQRLALLAGIEALIPESRPFELVSPLPALDQVVQASDQEVRAKAKQIADRLVWPGKEGYVPRETTLLTEEEKQWFKKGEQLYRQICATCHQSNGQGQEGVAVPLVGSEWVLGQKKDVVRIVLGGKVGQSGLMPPLGRALSNEEVAAVLTYVRNAWTNEGSSITPSLVREVRKSTAVRDRPWTEKELRLMLH